MSQIEPEQPQKERLPHSKYGIRSFRLALPSAVIYVLAFVALRATDHRLERYEYFEWLMFCNFCALGSILVAFVAFLYGVIGLFQQRTRKVFSILGIIFSVIPFLDLVILRMFFPQVTWAIIRQLDKLQFFF